MVRRQAAISAGLFDENFRRAEDYDLWLRIAHRASNMAYAREVLGKNRVVPGSLSHDNLKMLEGVVDVLRKLSNESRPLGQRTVDASEQARRCQSAS